MLGAGTLAALAAVAPGCRTRRSNQTTSTTLVRGFAVEDLHVGPLAAGLEQLAVDLYRDIGVAAGEELGPVPDTGAELLKTLLDHHQAHLERWNEVMRAAGEGTVKAAEPRLKPRVDDMLRQAENFTEALEVGLEVERVLAATYLEAIAGVRSRDARNLVGSIHVVEMQHAAVLRQITGEFPVPDAFATTDGALRP